MKHSHRHTGFREKLILFTQPTGHWFQVGLIVSVTVATFFFSFTSRISPEDEALARSSVVHNPHDHLTKVFGSESRVAGWGGDTYRPLVMASLALDYRLRGMSIGYFRKVNLLWHTVAALLVYWLVVQLTQRGTLALCAALLFAVGPTAGSCVGFISHRGDLMAGVGVLGSLALFTVAADLADRRRTMAYCGSLLALTLGLFSCEAAVLTPVLLLVYLVARGRPIGKLAWVWFAGLVAVELFYLGCRYLALGGWGAAPLVPMDWGERELLWLRALGAMVSMWLSPMQLPVDRSPAVNAPGLAAGFLAVGVVMVLVAVIMLLRCRKTSPGAWCGVAWLTICLLPLGLLVGATGTVAEHWSYLASVGVWLAVCSLGAVALAGSRFLQVIQMVVGLLVCVVVGCQMARLVKRNRDWRAEVTVIGQSLTRTPQATALHYNYGYSMGGYGSESFWQKTFDSDIERDKTVKQLRLAVALNPDNFDAHIKLAWVYQLAGKREQEIKEWREGIRLVPYDPVLHYLLGRSLGGERLAEALVHFRLARAGGGESAHFSAELRRDLAWLLATAPHDDFRNGPEAVELAERSYRLKPDEPIICYTLAAAYAEAGDFANAVRYARRSEELFQKRGWSDGINAVRRQTAFYLQGKPFRMEKWVLPEKLLDSESTKE